MPASTDSLERPPSPAAPAAAPPGSVRHHRRGSDRRLLRLRAGKCARQRQASRPIPHRRLDVRRRTSLDAAVKAGAIDEVSVDWLQSRPAAASLRLASTRTSLPRQSARIAGSSSRSLTTTRPGTPSTRRSRRRSSKTRRGAAATPRPSPPGAGSTTSPAWTWTGRRSRARGATGAAALVGGARRATLRGTTSLVVDVYPKLKEPGGWDGPRSQDWKRLGRAVDQFRVMTYNYSGSWSGPGPLSRRSGWTGCSTSPRPRWRRGGSSWAWGSTGGTGWGPRRPT